MNALSHGLGLAPSSPCFDPTRSSWLPYWINDTTETACMQAAENSVSLAQAAKQAVAPSVIPTLQYSSALATATSPGLPVNYDQLIKTGVIPANTTGATAPPAVTYPNAIAESMTGPGEGSDVPVTSEPWYCQFLGLGCQNPANTTYTWALALAAVGIVVVVGSRR